MADKKISDLAANSSPGVADLMEIVSGGTNYKVTPADLIAALVGGGLPYPPGVPGGRLTLTSGSPVMIADVANSASVYYALYNNALVPIYDGSTYWQMKTFAELTLTLVAAHQVSGSVYDVFIFLNGGVVTIGTGPAWSSTTSRGSGAATTELARQNGLWVNANSMTLWNSTTSYSIAAKAGTYVGSIYCNANASVTQKFKPAAGAGGSNNILGLYNAYNQVTLKSVMRASDTNWTYATATWRAANASNSMRITYLDGLSTSAVDFTYSLGIADSAGISGIAGVSLDAIAAPLAAVQGPAGVSAAPIGVFIADSFQPLLGLHFLQAVEYSNGATTTFYSTVTWGSAVQYLNLILRMLG